MRRYGAIGCDVEVSGHQRPCVNADAAGEHLSGDNSFIPYLEALMSSHIARQLAMYDDDCRLQRSFDMTGRLDQYQPVRFDRTFHMACYGKRAREIEAAFQRAFRADEAALT